MNLHIIIPNNWRDINIAKYQLFMKHQENENLSEKERVKLMIGVLCDVDFEIVNKMKYADIMRIHKELQKLVKTYNNHFELKKRIIFNDVEYGFIPNLSIITGGEFADIEHYLKDDIIQNMHYIMAVLYRPIKEDDGTYYNIAEYEPDNIKYEDFKNLTMDIVLGAMVFFYNLGEQLHGNLNNYSMKNEMKKMAVN